MQVVQKQIGKVTRGKDVKEEGSLINGPDQNWEQYLVPAPYTVQILAKVLQISTERDFSLEHHPPKDGFKHIRTPQSFRACLVQVAGDGYKAFETAHASMDNIRLRCQLMPNDFKEALGILFQGTPEDVDLMLPGCLNAIDEHSAMCKQLAENVKDRFDDVSNLLQELLLVTASNKGYYEDALEQAEVREKIGKMKKERYGKQEKEQEQRKNELKTAQDEAAEKFQSALDSIPSGWEVMGMNAVDGLLKTVNNVVGALAIPPKKAALDFLNKTATKVVDGAIEGNAEGGGGGDEGEETQTQESETLEPSVLNMIKNTTTIGAVTEGLKELFTYQKDPESGKKERKFNTQANSNELLLYAHDNMKLVKEAVENAKPKSKENVDLKKKATEVATATMEWIEGLQTALKDVAEVDVGESYSALLQVWCDSSAVETMTAKITKEPSLGTSGPNAKRAIPKMTQAQAKSVGQIAVENAKLKVELSRNRLNQTRQDFKAAQERYDATQDKMMEVLAQLEEATGKVIDFQSIKSVLIMGIKALGELKEQWANLVQFFIMVKNYISVTLNSTVKGFLKHARSGETKRLGGMTIAKFHQDMIYNNAFQAIKIAYNVEHISGAYVDISSKHLLGRIAGLAKIIGYDAETERDKIAAEVSKITAGCQDAQKQIKNEMENHRRNFESSASRRVSKIRKALDESLPDPLPEVLKTIENAGKLSKKLMAGDANLGDDNDDDDDVDLEDMF